MYENRMDRLTEIVKYFMENLPQYEVENVLHRSMNEADDYMNIVIAKHRHYPEIKRKAGGGEYVVWSCWNNLKKSLNHGYYDIKNHDAALNLAERLYDE